MTGLTDIVSSIRGLGNDTRRDVLLIRCPVIALIEGQIVKVDRPVLRHRQNDPIYDTAVQRIVPFFLDSNEVGIEGHVLQRSFTILSCNRGAVRNGYYFTLFCGFLICGTYLIRICFQRIGTSCRCCRRCNFNNLCFFFVFKSAICPYTVIQVSNQVVCSLAGPYGKLNNICYTIFQLESAAHIPMDSSIGAIVFRSRTAIRCTGRPFALVGVTIAILIVFSAIAIILKAVRIDGLHNFHLCISQCSDTVCHLNVTEAKGRLDGFRDGFECIFHRG